MERGIVQFFLTDKGYGYIRKPDTREEFYFKAANLLEEVKKGDQVLFEIKEDRYGLFAFKIQKSIDDLSKNS